MFIEWLIQAKLCSIQTVNDLMHDVCTECVLCGVANFLGATGQPIKPLFKMIVINIPNSWQHKRKQIY